MTISSEEFRIHYAAVPKVACTSIKAGLVSILDGIEFDGASAENLPSVHRRYPSRKFDLRAFEEMNGWWRFCVIRDPVKRLLSAYADKVVGREKLAGSLRVKQADDLPDTPDPDFFFQNMKRYSANSFHIRHHIMGAKYFLGNDLGRFEAVYRTDEIGQLANDLSRRMKTRVLIPKLNQSREAPSFDDLAAESREAIRRRTARDYELMQHYLSDDHGMNRKIFAVA